jgi:mannose-6-phosphate isomerase-like protein (cupin superfamily)
MAAGQVAKSSFPSIVKDFGFSPIASAVWRQDQRTGLEFRDLSLAAATGRVLVARHWRTGSMSLSVPLVTTECPFAFVFVVKGSVVLEPQGKDPLRLDRYTAVTRFGGGTAANWKLPAETEVFTIVGTPAAANAFENADVTNAPWIVSRDAPDQYVVGDGPRKFFTYRDLGTSAASGRRIHIQLVAVASEVPDGTGWHRHTMGQIFYVLEGWADLELVGHPWLRMGAGDAMCIYAGLGHNVPRFSREYALIEMCVPTDYDTIDIDGER